MVLVTDYSDIDLGMLYEKKPPGWIRLTGGIWENYHGAWMHDKKRLAIIASISPYQDGNLWVHLSISHEKRMPTYDDLVYLKRHWLGEDKKAIMVLPPKNEHVNIHEYCLHLYCCLTDDVLPDFTMGSGSI